PGLQAMLVLIAADDVQRHLELRQTALKTVDRRALRLYAAQGVGRPQRRMLGKLGAEVGKAAWVLVLKLNARRTDLVGFDGFGRAKLFKACAIVSESRINCARL